MKIFSNEIMMMGEWLTIKGKVVGDDTCKRIDQLVAAHLIKLGHDVSGWDTLYRDPDDGRLWELIYPQSEMHGGGPPQLQFLAKEAARAKYTTLTIT